MEAFSIDLWVALLGGVGGLLLGYVARTLRFCTLSAIENAAFGADMTQARMWALAVAVAILGTQGLHLFGVIDLHASFHWAPQVNWVGAVLGGLIFGLGMAAVGTCSFGSIVRAGGGDLRALMDMLVIGVVSYMTMRGVLGLLREQVIEATALGLPDGLADNLPGLLAALLGLDDGAVRLVVSLLLAGAALFWCFGDPSFRKQRKAALGGLLVGAVICSGWLITGVAGDDGFTVLPLGSFTYVRPVGDTLMYLMIYTGTSINFGVGIVAGTLAGAFLGALRRGEAYWEGFDDLQEMRRHIVGSAAMGFGGVVAMGCTIGQGLTGVGTLALTSFLAAGGIVAGGVLGVRFLVYGGTLPQVFGRGSG